MKVNKLHRERQPRGDHTHSGKSGTGEQGAAPGAAHGDRVKDANAGREYQGVGVLNKAGRFGSSTGAEQLGATSSEDAGRAQGGRDDEEAGGR